MYKNGIIVQQITEQRTMKNTWQRKSLILLIREPL